LRLQKPDALIERDASKVISRVAVKPAAAIGASTEYCWYLVEQQGDVWTVPGGREPRCVLPSRDGCDRGEAMDDLPGPEVAVT